VSKGIAVVGIRVDMDDAFSIDFYTSQCIVYWRGPFSGLFDGRNSFYDRPRFLFDAKSLSAYITLEDADCLELGAK
jgi:hypothetical protein